MMGFALLVNFAEKQIIHSKLLNTKLRRRVCALSVDSLTVEISLGEVWLQKQIQKRDKQNAFIISLAPIARCDTLIHLLSLQPNNISVILSASF